MAVTRVTGNLSYPCLLWSFAENTLRFSENVTFKYPKKRYNLMSQIILTPCINCLYILETFYIGKVLRIQMLIYHTLFLIFPGSN